MCDRLERHFLGEIDVEGRGRQSLTVGLIGQWGSGKTLHLQHIKQHFTRKLESVTNKVTSTGITVPIFFNAWRYEAEEHLIIPLLKTAQYQLDQWQKKWSEGKTGKAKTAFNWVQQRVKAIADSAIALSYGVKAKLDIPLLGEITFDPSMATEEDKKREQERFNKIKTEIDNYSSYYYDFESSIRSLTGRDKEENEKLNLLFLIDDLDRCLPDKVVRMLESIKLFLDMEGCAFVLAVDDEVVERSIMHRYRDYTSRPSHNNSSYQQHDNPITGHEYLEKIIQIPIPIPVPSDTILKKYLATNFEHLFGE